MTMQSTAPRTEREGTPSELSTTPGRLSPRHRMACERRALGLLVPGEHVDETREGDVFLKDFDGSYFWHAYGLVVLTDERTFLVTGKRSGTVRLEQSSGTPSRTADPEQIELPSWQSVYGTTPAIIRLTP